MARAVCGTTSTALPTRCVVPAQWVRVRVKGQGQLGSELGLGSWLGLGLRLGLGVAASYSHSRAGGHTLSTSPSIRSQSTHLVRG